VLTDIRDELVSVEAARDDYGVIVETDPLSVDAAATKARREELRRSRGWSEEPFVSWDDNGTARALDAAD